MTEPTEKLPISEFYKVIEYVTIFRSSKWWEAIVLFEAAGGRRTIGIYLWVNRNNTWIRKNKFSVRNMDEWNKVKSAVEQLAPKLTPK